MTQLTADDILKLFESLNSNLRCKDVVGELYLVGGAVMCLVHHARSSTLDVDGYFVPTSTLRQAAVDVGLQTGVGPDWLNDGVKGYLSSSGSFELFLDLSHLKVYSAAADYLLAMKCLAMRIGEEFHDIDDVRYLLRYLNIDSYESACETILQYYPIDRFPQKTLYVLEEILGG